MFTSLQPKDMAGIIAADCLKHAREFTHYHHKTFIAYLVGKADAAAFICPSVETISAENEIRFLQDYYDRHNLYWKLP